MAFGRKPRLRVFSPARGLTASATRLDRKGAEMTRQVSQQWQKRAWYFYDELGAIRNGSQFYSRPLSKLRLYAAERDDNGEVSPTENAQVIEQLDRIQDPGGGRGQLLATYGRLMFVAGESYLFVSNDDDGNEQWEFLSTDELRVEPSKPTRYSRIRAPSLGQEEFKEPDDDSWEPVADNEAVAYRIWRPHPRFSQIADSPMRSVLDICEELVLLTRSIRATARSRIANRGILCLPESISQAPPTGGPDEDLDQDPVLANLIEAMTKAIEDESSASALAPIVLRGDHEALAAIRHVRLVDPEMLYPEMGVRGELIKRLAIELDMPPESLLGMQDSNHWNAWMVDEQAWKDHQEPIAKELVANLTASFLRPTLMDAGLTDFKRFEIAYDDAEVVVQPDRSKDAKDLHDRIVLSDAALRTAAGFNDDDAPNDEEITRGLGVKIRDSSLAVYGIPGRIPGGTIEPEAGVVETADSPGGQDPNEVVKGPPAASDTPREDATVAAARIVGAAQLALLRARERAGARLRSLSKRNPDVEKLATSCPMTRVAATLGPDVVAALDSPEPRELVAGAGSLLAETLTREGIEDKVAEFLGDQIEAHAARTLFEQTPPPLPAAFANYVVALHAGLTPTV